MVVSPHGMVVSSHTCIEQPQCVVVRVAQSAWVNAIVGWLPFEGHNPSNAVIIPPLANMTVGRVAGVIDPDGIAKLGQNGRHG